MKQLDPKAIWLFFFSFIMRTFFPIAILSFWSLASLGNFPEDRNEFSWDFLNWLWVIGPIFLIICFVWAKLTHHFYRYEVTDSGFRKESGVIYKRYVTIPYDRIQNVDIYRGILARLLGLSDLQIQTAGASASVNRYGIVGVSAEGKLPGLDKNVAERLRDELINRTRRPSNQGL